MKRIIYLLIAVILIACKDSTIPADVKYEILKEEPNQVLSKDNIKIHLNKKVDEKILKEIALELRKDRSQYNNLFIFYYITDATDGFVWATTHFNPDLKITILGSTEAQDKETAKTADIDGEVIGKWRSEKSLMGGTLILYKSSEGKWKMRITFKDSNSMEEEITESTENGRTQYDFENGHGEYYILESNGNLGLYGSDGKFDEAVKIE